MDLASVKTHYSLAALATMGLPGFPTTAQAWEYRSKKGNWGFIEVKSKGGRGGVRKEYAPPADVLAAIRAKIAKELIAQVSTKEPASTLQEGQLELLETDHQRSKADARKGVLLAIEHLMEKSGYPLKKAATVLIDMARIGEADAQVVAMLKAARDERGRSSPDGLPSVRSLLRFVEYRAEGRLTPKIRTADLSVPFWVSLFLERYQTPEKPSVEHAYRQMLRRWPRELPNSEQPSIYQVRRFLKKVGNVSLQVGRLGPNELKTLTTCIRRGFDNLHPGDIYTADGHTLDAEVQHPLHGRPFRPEITSVVDVATRRVVGWSVGLAESALAVLDAVRDSCLKAGIPAFLYVDNGSGYKNEMMNDAATGLMSRLGIVMTHSLPYNSQARGVIERLHRTIWVTAAKEMPGYMGRDMDRQAKLAVFKLSRKAITQAGAMPLMAWPHFVDFCEQQVTAYNDRPHSSLPKINDPSSGRRRHLTPNEMWAQFVEQGFEKHRVSDDEARPLFRPQVLRTVRRGEIELFSNRYFAKALEEFHGDQLRVGYDIHDPNRVWVYDEDGRLICTAEWNANRRDYMPRSALDKAKDVREAARLKRKEAQIEEIHAERRGGPALESSDKVVMPGFMNVSRGELAAQARERQGIREEKVVASDVTDIDWTVPDTPEARWSAWQVLNPLAGADIASEKAKKWRHTYQATAEFRTYQRKSA